MYRRAVVVVAATALTLTLTTGAEAGRAVQEDVSLPLTVTLSGTVGECTNTGSSITLGATIGVGALGLTTIFKNNVKGTKEVTLGTSSMTVSDATVEELPKQPVLGGTGGNPYISVGLARENASGVLSLVSPTRLVGRCVQGGTLAPETVTSTLPTSAAALATGITCSSKGSEVGLDTSAASGGLYAVIVFDNNINKVVHRRIEAGDAVVPLKGGTTKKGWGQSNGAGGNPLVYLQWDDGDATTTNPEYFLGRCKDLMPA